MVTNRASEARITAKHEIRAHFDGVRGVYYSATLDMMASVSEDCQIKLWNIKNAKDSSSLIEPVATLRGHTAPILSITGPKMHTNESDEALARLIFTAGMDGAIKVWSIPDFPKDDKYPQTDGRNFCVGSWSDGTGEPYWNLASHPFLPLLLAVKASSKVQIWDCKAIHDKARDYDQGDLEKCKESFDKCDRPLKELELEVSGKKPSPVCCTWIPTDNNMLAIGYDSSHVAFFSHSGAGKLEHFALLEEQGSPITCIVAHDL